MANVSLLSRAWAQKWTALKLLLGVAILLLVARSVNWTEFWELARTADFGWLLGVTLLVAADRVYMAAKWRYLLQAMRVNISLVSAVRHYFMGGLVGTAVQWQFGGDIARVTRVTREMGRAGRVVSSVVIEKLVGLACVTALAIVAILLLNEKLGLVPFSALLSLAFLVVPLVLAFPFLLTSDRAIGTLKLLAKRLPFDRLKYLAKNLPQLRDVFDNFRVNVATFSGLTLLEQFVPPLSLLLLTRAYGDGIAILAALSVMPIIALLSRLPISLESIGVKEGLYVFFLGLVGYSATEAFALALTARVIDILVIAAGGISLELIQRGGQIVDAASN